MATEKQKQGVMVTPENITDMKENEVFVFGSNGGGAHLGGAAYFAYDKLGAVWGQAEGLQGRSYAIDTMDGPEIMAEQCGRFEGFAKAHPELTFYVTKIGCGIAGYEVKEVAGLFAGCASLPNVALPAEFRNEIDKM